MRTDVKIGLFVGVLLLVVAAWWFLRTPTPTRPAVPVGTAVGERPDLTRPTGPQIQPLPSLAAPTTGPAVEPSAPPMAPVQPSAVGLEAPATVPAAPSMLVPTIPRPIVPPPSAPSEGRALIGIESLVHVVRAGETLDSLAKQYYDDAGYAYVLREANLQVGAGRRVAAGTRLKVPELPPGARPQAAAAAAAGPGAATPVGAPSTRPAGQGYRDYKVQPGDTLWQIAAAELGAGTRWREILELNAQKLGGRAEGLKAGQTIRLPR